MNQSNTGRFPFVSYIPSSLLVRSDFQLPDPAGRAGGACTSTLLNILYKDEQIPQNDMSFVEVLEAMRVELGRKGFEQIPQLTSSKEIDLTDKFDLVPNNFRGNKYAVMIGINYVGHNPGELVCVLLDFLPTAPSKRPLESFPNVGLYSLLYWFPLHSVDATTMSETWYVQQQFYFLGH